MDKQILINAIIEQLEKIHQVALSATQTAIDAATDDETVPEHKYDTLALEASYLAHGQALRVQECESDIQQYKRLPVRVFELIDNVKIGALVELIDEKDRRFLFFMGPCAGGVTVECQGKEVSLLTSKAPLGTALLGKQVGDEISLNIAGKQIWYELVHIS
ncbi:GreA/GreB family elongation factor [Vibrio algarum]|uniref:GreA/GreB family elongation factor n=1 Tax=Vibrio algarum TaxID=3020714 RepID=A0ABT4YQ86_9VIBR|nr:GreA/GreB family elongation factor [Vibrio sp. KJ40-1]MDB1123194.1 GreA/GreB family elongation factor [Vibrio sp. KJ40-1]